MAALGRRAFLHHECGWALQAQRLVRWSETKIGAPVRHASTTSRLASGTRPFRIGIIGSGPAGFYSALRIIQKSEDAVVDMYEQLPTPFGLVRYGVAPDHPEVKNCQDRFAEVAASPRFNFVGNVSVGEDISLELLKPHYDALLFAYGASHDKTLGVPGEHLQGIYSARAFVGWYNGLPEYESLQPDLQKGENAVVIGNGNVALDIARILLSDVNDLRRTDISEQALEALSRSKVKHVFICGRRGPMQAAFTVKEIRELMHLPSVGFQPLGGEVLPSAEWIAQLPRLEQRKYRFAKLLAEGSATSYTTSSKTWALKGLVSPRSFEADVGIPGTLTTVVMTKNEFEDNDYRFMSNARVKSTDESISIQANLAFRSIGYKSSALQGLTSALGVPFDNRSGTIPNDPYGRILSDNGAPSPLTVAHVPGCYCAGWVKRGPTGVIASTMEDAFSSADVIVSDWADEARFLNGSTRSRPHGSGQGWEGAIEDGVKSTLRRVSWDDWLKIDAAERERGERIGKPREKFKSTAEMLEVLD